MGLAIGETPPQPSLTRGGKMYIMKRKITNKQFAKALYEAIKDLKGEKLHKALKRFVVVLIQNHKLKKAEKIIAEFIRYSKKQEGIVEMSVASARRLEKHTLGLIDKAFGGKTEMTEDLDTALIGGVKIKTEDKIFDGSIKKQLLNLKKQLVN